MAIDPGSIRRGMAVYAFDGEKIGVVTGVETGAADDGDGDWAAENETMDSLAAGDGPDMSPSEGQTVAGRNTLGPAPTGTTGTEKDRGSASTVGLSATLGDVHRRDEQRHAEPGAGGMDVVRGYGTAEAGAAEIGGGGPPATGTPIDAVRGFDDNQAGPETDGPRGTGAAGTARHEGYIQVQDQGTLGVGARGLRVPFSGVVSVAPGESITLDCTREQAGDHYGSGASLDIDEDADVTPF